MLPYPGRCVNWICRPTHERISFCWITLMCFICYESTRVFLLSIKNKKVGYTNMSKVINQSINQSINSLSNHLISKETWLLLTDTKSIVTPQLLQVFHLRWGNRDETVVALAYCLSWLDCYRAISIFVNDGVVTSRSETFLTCSCVIFCITTICIGFNSLRLRWKSSHSGTRRWA